MVVNGIKLERIDEETVVSHGGSIDIDDGIVSVAGDAAKGIAALTRIAFPSSLRRIGSGAFFKTGLREIRIDVEGNLSVEDLAFSQCEHIETVFIRAKEVFLGTKAFKFCTQLRRIHIVGDVHFGEECFYCAGRDNEEIPLEVLVEGTVLELGDKAFANCHGLKRFDFSRCRCGIGAGAFDSAGLGEAILGEGIVSIGEGAFSSCDGLRRLSIGKNVVSIGGGLFYFGHNEDLVVEIDAENPRFRCENHLLINEETGTLLFLFSPKEETEIHLPERVRHIASHAVVGAPKVRLYVPAALTVDKEGFDRFQGTLYVDTPQLSPTVRGTLDRLWGEKWRGVSVDDIVLTGKDPHEGIAPLSDEEVRGLATILLRDNPLATRVVTKSFTEVCEAHCHFRDLDNQYEFPLEELEGKDSYSFGDYRIKAIVGDQIYALKGDEVVRVPFGRILERFDGGPTYGVKQYSYLSLDN